ncbi:MAG TPA: hypothetical protein VK668_19675 [Mucilaginibacter sp.]|nr:hypothetical protein [Mucilaginibacter sp.]
MKLKNILIILLAVTLSFVYSGCLKPHDPVGPTLSGKAVSSLVVLNLSQNLYDGYGVFNINAGLNSAPPPTLNRQVKHVNLLKLSGFGRHSGCGVIKDMTIKRDTVFADTIQASIVGYLRFSFFCVNGIESGFRVLNNLSVSEINAQRSGTFKLDEDLTMKSTDPNDIYANVNLTGAINSSSKQQIKTGSKQPAADSFYFELKKLTINSYGDIYSGSATFSTTGSNASGVWDYHGTIDFLGGNQAKITINGTVYNIDIHTGLVTD